MYRKLRIIKPKTYYHIYSRGTRKQEVFFEENDYSEFLDDLMFYCEKYNILINAYVLLNNHFHLLLYCFEGNLDKFMHNFLSKIAIKFNKKYNNSGHVFQGRYKYKIVKDDDYFFKLVNYIHTNPIKALLVNKAENYLWSSLKYYFNMEIEPENWFLDKRKFFEIFKGNAEDYKNYYYSNKIDKFLIDDSFEKNMIRAEYDKKQEFNRRNQNIDSQPKDLKRRKQDIIKLNKEKVKNIVNALYLYFKIENFKEIMKLRIVRTNFSRIFVYFLRYYTDLTYKEIGIYINKVNIKNLHKDFRDVSEKIKSDKEFAKTINNIKYYINSFIKK